MRGAAREVEEVSGEEQAHGPPLASEEEARELWRLLRSEGLRLRKAGEQREAREGTALVEALRGLRRRLLQLQPRHPWTAPLRSEVGREGALFALEAGDLQEFLVSISPLLRKGALPWEGHGCGATLVGLAVLFYSCHRPLPDEALQLLRRHAEQHPLQSQAVRFAMEVHWAVQGLDNTVGFLNYRRFFRLFAMADPNQRAIMAKRVEEVRKHALAVMARAYMALPVDVCVDFLGFEGRSPEGRREGEEWLRQHGFPVEAGAVPLKKRRHQPS